MEVHKSARKHGIGDADVVHAVTHYLYAGAIGDEEHVPWRVLYLGPDRAGNLLEVVVLERDHGSDVAIHAMRLRKRYAALLESRTDE